MKAKKLPSFESLRKRQLFIVLFRYKVGFVNSLKE
jgi:hypothetical protein